MLERLRPECESIIAQYEQKRSALLPIMHVFQQHEGFVSAEAMAAAAEMLEITPAEVEGAVSFYTLLYRRPVGKYMLQVCRGLACSINGAEDIMAYFREKLGIGHLQTTDDGLFSYEEVECLAACDRATLHGSQPRIRLRSDAAEDRRDAGLRCAPARTPSRRWRRRELRNVRGRSRKTLRSPPARNRAAPAACRSPNNAGGIGDASGIIMLDNIINRDVYRFTGTTRTCRRRFARGRRNRSTRKRLVPVTKILTAGIGEVDLRDIDVYRQRGGYKQWERVVRELQPVDVLDLAEKSGLRGRGGAGFPTGRKWSFLPRTSTRAISSATATKPSRARSKTTCCSKRRRIWCSREC